ncbi:MULTISPECIES: H-NS family nucleoid-associated regulatory protein [Caballeronia]|jgi:DNA-binding protein H-NS|uniref:H-NS family nucleoid-associated regulatory protein n=1 Tax=unclassified Caballeronia TaxID=2646786 RepID=UPI0024589630|nr:MULTISPECIES: H-NS family nucleoid-associated regulatory protein [Caballeronia]MDR5736254.1 H-NS family nucleoid-associated regulatory protein [Caballeronia sp. LZ025]
MRTNARGPFGRERHEQSRVGRTPQKAQGTVQGRTTAKYRDPKTGATWSGMGRAPGWIANARNRDRFMIEQQ